MLVFPAYFRRDRPELTEHPPAYVRYTFMGSLDEVYTTLVVRLYHTDSFERDQLWRDAADFKTPVTGLRAGLKLERKPESSGTITVFLDPKIPIEVKATFMKFVHDHLTTSEPGGPRTSSGSDSTSATDAEIRSTASPRGMPSRRGRRTSTARTATTATASCSSTGSRNCSSLPRPPSGPEEWKQEAQAVMDSQSLEQILLGHVQAIAGEAGQIWRPTSFGDQGIDGEIEFKDHKGKETGRKIYLQLKSGNSYLQTRQGGRRRDPPDQALPPRRILAESAMPGLARHPDHR